MRIWVVLVVGAFALSCSEKCSVDNCDGCCSASGECLTGNSNTACGHAGESCNSCAFGEACFASACVSTQPSGGSGGTTGGGVGTTGGGAGNTGGGIGTGGGSAMNGLPSGSWVKQIEHVEGQSISWNNGLAFDSSGHIYASIAKVVSSGQFPGDLENQSVLAKYDATGVEAWSQTLDFPLAQGVAVDLDNAYVFGRASLSKFDTQGNQVWTHATERSGQQFDGVGFGSNHDVWAYGSTLYDGSNRPLISFLSRYSADGTPQGSLSSDGGSWLGVAADAQFYFVYGGALSQTRLDAGIDWSFTLHSPDGGAAYITHVIPGAPGQTFVADYFITSDAGPAGRVRELGATGNEVWVKNVDGMPRGIRFEATANRLWIATAKQLEVAVTSFVGGTQQSQLVFGTSGDDYPQSLAVSPTQVCVGGQTTGAFAGYVNLDAGFDAFIACIPR